MKLSDYDYFLPKELIAKYPAKPRDHSRLLVMDKVSGILKHRHFFDLLDFLRREDVLVFNNSCVIPARLVGKKKNSGGAIEVLLHKKQAEDFEIWECLIGGRKIKEGLIFEFDDGLEAEVVKKKENELWLLKFNKKGESFLKTIDTIGKIPLPPYIENVRSEKQVANDKEDYQTIYANKNKSASVAAPTAGLHFSEELLEKIREMGISMEYVTLHVGMGTFAPVKSEDISQHKIHSEQVEIDKETIKRIYRAKMRGKRIIAVGTTSTRSLEALAHAKIQNKNCDFRENVDIFIFPGYEFRFVDAMITNFHLPKSTLLMLVSAFSSKANIDNAYRKAIQNKYRFYSYGDAMFIC